MRPGSFGFSASLGWASDRTMRHSEAQNTSEVKLDREGLRTIPPFLTQLTHIEVLWLPYNELQGLDGAIIGRLGELIELNAQSNQIQTLPYQMSVLTRLQRLFLHSNHIAALESVNWKALSRLQVVTLARNKISSLPTEFAHLTSLQSLHLSDNMISSLPGQLSSLTRLQTLDIQRNQFEHIPSFLFQMPILSLVPIDGNHIPQDEAEIWKLVLIQRSMSDDIHANMKISGGQLLPSALQLDLSGKNFSILHETLTFLTNLLQLHVYDNILGPDIPHTFFPLAQLRVMRIHNNSICRLPRYFLNSFPQLHTLTLHGNRLSQFTDDEVGSINHPLSYLTLDNNQLTSVPSRALYLLSSLTHLTLHQNTGISCADQTIWDAHIQESQKWDLGSMQLTALPSSFFEMLERYTETNSADRLFELSLENNRLEGISFISCLNRILPSLQYLTHLNIGGNSIGNIPSSISFCSYLNILNGSSIGLTSFPGSLLKVSRLTKLILSNNNISFLPETLVCMTQLVHLDLQKNPITRVPDFVGGLLHLSEILLEENICQGLKSQDLIYSLRATWHSKCTWTRSRIIVVGEPLSGKSTFIQGLLDHSPSPINFFDCGPPQEGDALPTPALQSVAHPNLYTAPVDTCEFGQIHSRGLLMEPDLPSQLPLHFQFWEFSDYRSIAPFEQFVFHQGSIVTIVYNPMIGFKRNALVHWLTQISASNPGTHIILVSTNQDQFKSLDQITQMQFFRDLRTITDSFREYVKVIGNISINLENVPSFFNSFRENVLKATESLPFIQCQIPIPYLKIAAKIQCSDGQKVPALCSFSDFVKSFQKEILLYQPSQMGFSEEKFGLDEKRDETEEKNNLIIPTETGASSLMSVSVNELLFFLAQHGLVIWDSKSNNRDFIITNPQWFINTLRATLRSIKEQSPTLQCLPTKQIAELIDATSPSTHQTLLRMLHNAGISFSSSLDFQIFPMMLPFGLPPVFKWSVRIPDDCASYVSCVLKFNRLPAGFFPRLMAFLYSNVLPRHFDQRLAWSFCSATHFVFDFPVEDANDSMEQHGSSMDVDADFEPEAEFESGAKIDSNELKVSDEKNFFSFGRKNWRTNLNEIDSNANGGSNELKVDAKFSLKGKINHKHGQTSIDQAQAAGKSASKTIKYVVQKKISVCIEYYSGESCLVFHARSSFTEHSVWKAMNYLLIESNKLLESYPGLTCEKLVACPVCILHQIPIEFAGVRPLDSGPGPESAIRCSNNHVLTFHEWMSGTMSRGYVITKMVTDMPVLYDMLVDTKSSSSRCHLRIMCDNPISPHIITAHPGYMLPRLPVLLWRHGTWMNRITKSSFLMELAHLRAGLPSIDQSNELFLQSTKDVNTTAQKEAIKGELKKKTKKSAMIKSQSASRLQSIAESIDRTRSQSFNPTTSKTTNSAMSGALSPPRTETFHAISPPPSDESLTRVHTSRSVQKQNKQQQPFQSNKSPPAPLGMGMGKTAIGKRNDSFEAGVVVKSYFDVITGGSPNETFVPITEAQLNQEWSLGHQSAQEASNTAEPDSTDSYTDRPRSESATSISPSYDPSLFQSAPMSAPLQHAGYAVGSHTTSPTSGVFNTRSPPITTRKLPSHMHRSGSIPKALYGASGASKANSDPLGSTRKDGVSRQPLLSAISPTFGRDPQSPDLLADTDMSYQGEYMAGSALHLSKNWYNDDFIPESIEYDYASSFKRVADDDQRESHSDAEEHRFSVPSIDLGYTSNRTETYRYAIQLANRVRYEVPDPSPLCSMELRMKELDPDNSWAGHIFLTRLPNEQTRWLCKDCHQRFRSRIALQGLCAVASGKSGVLFMQAMEASSITWKKMFVHVDYARRRFSVYPDIARPLQVEMDLSKTFVVKRWSTDQRTHGFIIQGQSHIWNFRAITKSEQESWVFILEDIKKRISMPGIFQIVA